MSNLIVRCQANTFDGFRSVTLSHEKEDLYKPFMKALAKEVSQQTLYIQKKFVRFLQKAQVLLIPFLVAPTVQAEEEWNFPILKKAYGLDILPDEVITILIQLVIGCGILGVLFAMICLMVAGCYRMIGQKDKARLWSIDIIKGLGQVLLAPAIILILVTIIGLIFQSVPGLEIFF